MDKIAEERNRLSEIRRGIEELKENTRELVWRNHPNIAIDEVREQQGLPPLKDADRECMNLPSKDEGDDSLRLLLNRTEQEPQGRVTFDSIRSEMGLRPLDQKTREKLGLTE
jgi:hypothetical protein